MTQNFFTNHEFDLASRVRGRRTILLFETGG